MQGQLYLYLMMQFNGDTLPQAFDKHLCICMLYRYRHERYNITLSMPSPTHPLKPERAAPSPVPSFSILSITLSLLSLVANSALMRDTSSSAVKSTRAPWSRRYVMSTRFACYEAIDALVDSSHMVAVLETHTRISAM